MLWSVNRHAAMFLGSGRAGLLQLAHPWVAQAIDEHSATRGDPYGRFQRTFRQVFSMVFGDLDAATAAARRVHSVHSSIRGRLSEPGAHWPSGARYDARDPQALLWVHATLWETSIKIFETFFRPLTAQEKDDYYRETCLFAQLFGIPSAEMPADWDAFESYNRDMWSSPRLSVGAVGRSLADLLFTPPDLALEPVARAFRNLTAGLLPEPVRAAFELPWGDRERRSFERSVAWLRRAMPYLPRRLRYVPPYLKALRRIDGDQRPDRIGELLARIYMGEAPSSHANGNSTPPISTEARSSATPLSREKRRLSENRTSP